MYLLGRSHFNYGIGANIHGSFNFAKFPNPTKRVKFVASRKS